MAVSEGEYLLLQQGEKLYMLLRNADRFHLFTVDKRFTEEREEMLMQRYPCSEEALRELGVNFIVLSLRGFAASGSEAGDALILYAGKKKLRYILSDDYSQEQMGHFFDRVEKFQMPREKRKHKASDWRLEKQKKELVPIMKGVKYLLLCLSIVSCAGLLFHHPGWSILGILVSIACGVLELVLPQYFTLLDMSRGSQQKHAIGLTLPGVIPIMVQALYVFKRFEFLNLEIFFWSVGAALVICGTFGFFAREFAERTGDLLVLLLLLGLFSSGPIGMVNSLTDTAQPETYSVVVEDMWISAGKSTDYFCRVMLKDGEEFSLSVTREQYENITTGQTICIAHHDGGLGIEYISLVES